MEKNAIKILEMLQDDPEKAMKIFGSLYGALRFIHHSSPEILMSIDTNDNIWYDSDLQDMIINFQLQNFKDKKEVIKNFIHNHSFNELEVQGDKIFWNLKDEDDLSELFIDTRNSNLRSVVERLLKDDYYEWYYNDFYSLEAMIEDLNPKNLAKIKRIVIEKLNGRLTAEDVSDSNSLLLDEMLEIQGNPETLEINDENVSDILDDKDTRKYIFDNYLDEEESLLRNAYQQAQNDAYHGELFKSFTSSVEDFLGNLEFYDYTLTTKDGNKLYRKGAKIDVTPSIERIFSDYFSNASDHYHQIDYYGNFLNMLKEYMDEENETLDFRIPDYPDSYEVEKIYNEIVEI